jgi:2-dehydropantoate 2-reductase
MKIMMIGAGSVGGYFGAKLARAGIDCTFLLRPRTLAAVKAHGLTVRSRNEIFTVRPVIGLDPCELPRADLVCLGIKRYDLDATVEQLRPVLNARTTILTLQNGVDTETRLRELVPDVSIVGGVAYIYSKIAEPGVIEHYKKGTLAIGHCTGPSPSVSLAQIKAVFESAGISCQLPDDIQRTKWEKMCWNVVFNALTVLINDTVAKAISYPELRSVIAQIVDEAVAVAEGDGVKLPTDMAERIIQWSHEIRDIHTSMYDDWKAGRRTEIDHLNGYIVRRAKALGLRTPVNEVMVALVKTLTEPQPVGPALTLDGELMQPVVLDGDALAKLPVDAQVDVAVLSPGMHGQGVKVKDLLDIATPKLGADHVTFHSADGTFAVTMTLQQAADTGILIYRRDGAPLPAEAGGPFRLITPGLGDLCANVKHVSRIEFRQGTGKDTRPTSPKH